MKKIKIVSEEKRFKPFEIELKEYLMDTREDIMNKVFDQSAKKNFTYFLEIIELGTGLSKEEIHDKYSNDQIYAISRTCIEAANKKKL